MPGRESGEVQHKLRQREDFALVFNVVMGELFLSDRRRTLRHEREKVVLGPMAAAV